MKKQPAILLSVFLAMQLAAVKCTDRNGADRKTGTERATASPAAGQASENRTSNGMVDFVNASRSVTPAVVHIKTRQQVPAAPAGAFGRSYGSPSAGGVAIGSGSGVIIENDGYIATNNHVIEDAEQIEVILPDKRVFGARLVGRDPNTDLALLKIDGRRLPIVQLGNSDLVQVGEWVLAVGYPFSLNTTVTAGIVSAKARSIGIINQSGNNDGNPGQASSAIESFIQTDAAINPGNSGGALVNTNGELVGINSAIASQTGSYAGYAFAIPVNLAKKILDDLKKYGVVKRGVLGVSFPSPAAEDQFLAQQGLDPGSVKGVYITGVLGESAAAQAGLREGDIIQSIDGNQLSSSSEFSERIARHKPGDVLKLTYMRNGKIAAASVTLKEEARASANTAGDAESLGEIYERLGARFAPLTNAMKQQLNLSSGVLVTDVAAGGIFEQVGIPEGTIIAFINGKPIDSPGDIDRALLSARRGIIQILAIAPDGSKVVFNFSLGT